MPIELTWSDVAIRLALTTFAGGCIGLNRGERGQPAGLRTTILVCVAAAMSMVQANWLLKTAGKGADSFVVLDLMRLPLGVLSGMGFIGAGAILRRGDLVTGVTTAATLWYVTVMGLCFGGGQLGLGLAMLGLGLFVLWALKRFERWLKHDHHVRLRVVTQADSLDEDELRRLLAADGLHVRSCAVSYNARLQRRSLHCHLKWHCRGGDVDTPPVVGRLAGRPGVVRIDWRP
ncbi:MAG TPA: MgtC/SapB family protein [Pirellulales bacterium]|nr:MgtC/SapB family protein [Pirellulales bacterium]